MANWRRHVVDCVLPLVRYGLVACVLAGAPCVWGQWYDTYKDLDAIHAQVDRFAQLYPSRVTPQVIGQSYEQRPIRAFKIAGASDGRVVKPALLLNSLMHAREWITPMASMYAADQLLAGYGTDPRVTRWLDQFDVWVLPVNNPDGYAFTWQAPANRLWRKNRRPTENGAVGVDLNRNFDFAWGGPGSSGLPTSNTYRGPSAFSEPETRALRDFYHAHPNLVTNIDLHSYSQLVLGPYGHSATEVAEHAPVFDKLGEEMATAMTLSDFQLFRYERASDLYLASGLQSDWSYATQGLYSYTYELRPGSAWPGFELPEDQIVAAVQEAYAGIETMLDFTYQLTMGDFNYDQSLDCADLDRLTAAYAMDPGVVASEDRFEFDMSGDGLLSPMDVASWLSAQGFGSADVNLDGRVDQLDRQILLTHQGQATFSFCAGDLNTDGLIDAGDLRIFQSAVPEPEGIRLVLLGCFGMLGHRVGRRSNSAWRRSKRNAR